MKAKLVLSTLIVLVSSLLLQAAPVDDRIAEGRAALAAHDLATARAKFLQARTADPTNQTAAALSGLTRWFAMIGDAPANAVLNGLGISSSGRDVYNWNTDIAHDASDNAVLPSTYNLESTRSFWRDTLLPNSIAVRADFAAVTDDSFVLTLTPTEIGASHSVTLDRADLLVLQAGMRAFEMLVNAGLGQNFNGDYQRLLKLAQGDVLTFRQVMEDNPDLLKAGPLEHRLAAKQALLDFVALFRRASSAVRARPAGLDRMFMLETEDDFSAEAEFRQHLAELEKSATDYVELDNGRLHVSFAPMATAGWSIRGSLPAMSNGRFDPLSIADASLGGVLLGTSREFFARALVEAGYTADLGWTRVTPNPASGALGKYAYSGTHHVVTGINGTIGRSADGVNWTFTQLPNAQDLFSIASNGAGVLVAEGNTQIWRSADHGATWKHVHTTWRGSAPDNEGGQFGMVWDGTRFVSITANGYIWSSSDLGLTWKRGNRIAAASATLSIFGLDYANGLFVATGSTTVAGGMRSAIFTSTNATSWTLAFTGATSSFYRTATYGAGKWIATGQSGRLAYSTNNGASWAEIAVGLSSDFFSGSTFANNTFVLSGSRTGTSTDGLTWTFAANPESIAFADAVAAPDSFTYLPGPQGALYRFAPNGTFTRLDNTATQIARNVGLNDAVVFNGKLYVAGAGGKVYESTDGNTFTERATSTTNNLFTLTVHNGVLYAGGALGTIVASSDGADWQTRISNNSTLTTGTINRIASLNGRLVAGASNAVVLTSQDGSAWTRRNLSGGGSVASLAYGNGYYIAGLFNQNNPTNNYTEGAIYFSTDTVTWTRWVIDQQPGLGTTGVRAAVFDQARFYFFLTSGRVLRTFSANPAQGWEDVAGDLGALSGAARIGVPFVANVGRTNDESRAGFVYTFNPDNWEDWIRTELPSSEFPVGAPTLFNNRIYYVGGNGGIYRANKPLTRPAPLASTPVTLVGQIGRHISLGAPFATSEELDYQWFYNGSAIAGANSGTFDVANLTNAAAGTYTVTATGRISGASATNTVTLLVVNGPPSITQQPTGGVAAAGTSFTFGVAAGGSGPISYQWFKNNSAINGATAATFALNSVTANDTGSYRVEVTNTYGTAVSADAQLSVSAVGAAPAFWDDTEANMYSPSRVFSDGNGHLFMTWNVVSRAQDVVAGIRTGSLFRLDEATGAIDPTFVWDERLGSPLFVDFQPDGKLLVAVNHAYGEGATVVRVNADGSWDNSYTAPRFSRSIRFIHRQSDGKLLISASDVVSGSALLPAGTIDVAQPSVYRLNADGTTDSSFTPVVLTNGGTIFCPPVTDSAGNIYVIGNFSTVNGSARRAIARVNSSGVLDDMGSSGQLPGGWASNSIARAAIFQSDGRVVVVGRFAYTGRGNIGTDPILAVRFNADGTFDDSFAKPLRSQTPINGAFGAYGRYATIDANDKFLVTSERLLRFNSDGSLDVSWPTNGTGYNKEIFWIGRSPTSGNLYIPDLDNNTPGNVGAFTAAGQPLDGFNTGGFGSTVVPETAILLNDGRVLAAGSFDHFGDLRQPGTALFGTNGLLAGDSTPFHNPGVLLQNPYAYVFQWPDRSFAVARADRGEQQTGNGSSDPTFTHYNADGSVRGNWSYPDYPTADSYVALPDGGMIAWRSTVSVADYVFSGTNVWMRRYRPDGSYDPDFAPDLSAFVSSSRDSANNLTVEFGAIAGVQVAGDGSIFVLAAGRDGSVALRKLLPNGAADSGYTSTGLAAATVSSGFSSTYFDPVKNQSTQAAQTIYAAGNIVFRLLPDGSAWVAGTLNIGGTPRNVARLTAAGTVDANVADVTLTNNAPLGLSAFANALGLDDSGRIYLAGRFDTANGNAAAGLIRFNTDGTLDTAWVPGVEIRDPLARGTKLVAGRGWLHLFGPVAAPSDLRPVGYKRVAIANVAPVIVGQSTSRTVHGGETVQLYAGAFGGNGATYAWTRDGQPVLGAVGPFLNLGAATTNVAGTYRLTVTNNVGSAQTTDIVLTFSSAPAIVSQPQPQTVVTGESVMLHVKATSATALSYQWKRNGTAIEGATNDHYTIESVSSTDAGDYTVVVTNATNSVESAVATVTVNPPPPGPDAPTITQQPFTQTVYPGYTVSLGVTVTAPTGATITTYQWYQNNSLYSTFTANGALSSNINVNAPSAGSSNSYYVVVTASNGGKATSATATLTGGTPLAVGTIAGTSTRGAFDGTGSAARFSSPQGAVGDGAGNLYVVDSYNHTIRRVTSAGVVTTFAGAPGISGSTDGALGVARFSYPRGIALDGAGNFYVLSGSSVRKISNGTVTTLAGSAFSHGYVDATGSNARFNNPNRLAVDGAGNVYVSDSSNHAIRKITPDGVVTTLAGGGPTSFGSSDGVGTAARFNFPWGIIALADGTLFVSDFNNATLRRVAPDGTVTTVAGAVGFRGHMDGSGADVRLSGAFDLFHDGADALYMAESLHTLRRVDIANGYAVTTIAGTAYQAGSADGTGTAARFNTPSGIGWMGNGLGIVDRESNSVRHITPEGVVTTLAGVPPGYADGTGSAARFYFLEGVARDASGNLYVTDNGNHVIRKITPAGVVSRFTGLTGFNDYVFVDGPADTARFASPRSLAINPSTGVLYVLDNGTVRQVQPDGSVSLLAGRNNWETGSAVDGTGIEARFSWAFGLAVAPNGDVYVADSGNHVLRKITPAGVVTTVAGVAGSGDTIDGSVSGGVARLYSPMGVAVDADGNVYFGQGNNVVRKLDVSGNVTTIAGLALSGGQVDGLGTLARISSIASLAMGPDGNLYLGSWGGSITRITPAGAVSTIVGSPFGPGYVDAAGSSARLDYPAGLAIAPDGTIYVADRNNSVVRRVYVGTPLSITTQPVGANVLVGSNHTFSVVASSTASISYQWTKNGTDIPNATNSSLALTNLATADSGTYAVRLTAGNSTIWSNNAGLTVSQPIANDNFANALQLSGLSGTTGAISNLAATAEAGEPLHWGTGSATSSSTVSSSLWYSYRPIGTGVATFDTVGSAIDTAMAVYTGSSLANLAFLAQNNDTPTSTASRVTIPVTAGTTYYVAVGSNTGTRGNIALNYSLAVTPEPAIAIATTGQGASLTVQPDAANSVGVQWAREGSDLAGATIATLTQSTAGVYSAGFVVGANAADYSASVPAVLLSVPAGSVTATDFFGGIGLDAGWSAMQETSWPETDTELSVARGRLNYGTAYATSFGYRAATRATMLPLDRNWTVVARVGLQGGNIAGTGGTGNFRIAAAQLSIVNVLDPTDRLDAGFRLVNDSGATNARTERFAQATVNNGMPTVLGIADLAAKSMLTRLTYDPATGGVTVAYSTGGAFEPVGTTFILSPWGNNRAGYVTVSLGGMSQNLFVPTGAVWVDDFATVVEPPAAPTISLQPVGGEFAEGSTNQLSIVATSLSPAPFFYQWFKDGIAIAGATDRFYGATSAGSYTVAVTQNGVTTTSSAAVITLAPSAPTFFPSGNIASSFAPAGGVLPAGSSAALTVTPAAGSAPLSYQWRFNDVDIPGATAPFYFIGDWQKANEGLYSVRISNSLGTATSPGEAFFVTSEGGWRWRNPTPTGNGATRVAFLNGQFIMGGLRGTLLVSNDGLAWATRQIPAQNNLFKFVTLGDRTLAMGSLNGMFVSRDTVTWETRPTGINGGLTSLQDMVSGNGRIVAFGTGGVTAVSTDGINWTPGTLGSGVTDTLFGATYVLNKFYGVSGSTGKVFSSTDGANWSSVSTGATSLQALAYGAGRLVAVGATGSIVVSSNGTSWTPVSSGTTNQLLGVNFVNNRFIVVGENGVILTSPDGLIWTSRSVTNVASRLQNAAYGNGRYIIAGQGGRVILTSTDAENWSVLTAGPYQGTHFNGVAASDSAAVAVGDFGAIVASTDGATWTQRNSTTTNQLVDIAYAAGKFVAVGGTGTVLVSTNGVDWTWQSLSSALSTTNLQGIRYSAGFSTWIVVGNNGGIYTAPDVTPPFTWTKQTSGTSAQLRRVAHGGGQTVAVGASGTIVSASDPTGTWTARTSNTTAQFNDVVYGGGAFVAVGNGGTVSRSTDGATWTTTTLGTLNLLSVTYLNGHFVATAPSNNYYTSTDGITWTGRTTGAGDQLNDTVLFNNQVVGVGRFGTILTADTPIVQGGGTINADEGAPATIKFAVSNSPFPVTYSWFKDAQPISGPNAPVMRIASVTASDAGAYTLQATNAFGSTTSGTPVTLALNVSLSITTHPAPQTAIVGGSATFNAAATGVPAPTYQWRFNGAPIAGATASSLTLNNLRLADNGTITVAVTNAGGTLVSNGASLTVNPVAPAITSPLSASAVANAPFRYQIGTNQTLAQFGASGLPSGLSINTTTGVIEGTPTQTGTFNITLTATNVTGSDQQTLVLAVQPPAPVITSPASASGRVGQTFTYTITATNSPTSYDASSLPPGLTRTGATISGTPTTAGFYAASISAQNATGTASQPLNVQIAAPLNAPVFTGSSAISGTAGTNFSFTPNFGSGITAWALVNLPDGTASTLPTGLTFNTSTGAITGNTAQTGTFKVAIRATNADGNTTQVITFTINPAASAPVVTSNGSTVGTVGSAFTFNITTNPAATSFASTTLPGGLTLNATTGVITGVPTDPGISNVTLTLTNSAGSSTSTLMITINSSALAPVITNSPIAAGTAGSAFSFTLSGSNSPTSFAVVSGTLPAGLSLNTSTGAITGTPSAAGQTRVWVAASNGAGGRGPAVEMLFDIARALTVPVITSNGTAAGQVGQPFQYQIIATNAPTSYAATTLPNGLSFSTSTGIISGLPTVETTIPFEVTLTASNADGASAPKTLAITITPAPATPKVTSPLNVGGRVGNAFSYQITATESPTSFTTDQLPDGLTLDSTTGVISGTPTSAGAVSVQLRAANAAGLGQASTLVIELAAPLTAPAITSDATANGKVGTLFSYQIVATNTPTSYGLSGTLPAGLSINTTTGLISGNPADNPGLYTVTLTAINSAGTSQPQTLLIGIAPADNAPVITSPSTATGMVSVPFSYQITATNVPSTTPFPPSVFLDAIDLPPGLAVNASTGLIQGTPSAAGTYLVSLVGVNANGTGLPRTLTLTISPAPNAPAVNSAIAASAQAGTVFSYQITATNNPTAFEALDAPAWLSVNTATGLLSGTPPGPGTVTLRIGASNAGGSSVLVNMAISIAAAPNTPVVTSSQSASGRVGQAFAYDISASLSPTSYVVSGLPAGLTVDTTNGQIRGTPTTSGTFNVVVSGVNANGQGQPVTIVVTIATSIKLAGG